MKTQSPKIVPLPFVVYFTSVALLALAGLVDSLFLAVSHYRVYTDMAYSSFCAISKALNCDTVSQSTYSILWGMPVPVWGIIGYTILLLLLPFALSKDARKQRVWPIFFLLSLGYSLYSVILAVISTYYIRSYCLMCVLSYGINFLLLYASWLIRKRFDTTGLFKGLKLDFTFLWKRKRTTVPVFFAVICFCTTLLVFFPSYWSFPSSLLSRDMPRGFTKEGYPWIGAETPEFEIMEFADYQCFQCKKMHFFLRRLLAEYPTKIRLIHRHFPMEDKINPLVKEKFHVGSGTMALLTAYAQIEGKFWETNDLLYSLVGQKDEINLKELSETIGLDYEAFSYAINDGNLRYKVKHDIASGIKMGINGTPAFVIDGEVYQGQIPAMIIKKRLK
jgi:uncharacterized membrane protein/predicted DsbA family dithiol-disulfide isomerase